MPSTAVVEPVMLVPEVAVPPVLLFLPFVLLLLVLKEHAYHRRRHCRFCPPLTTIVWQSLRLRRRVAGACRPLLEPLPPHVVLPNSFSSFVTTTATKMFVPEVAGLVAVAMVSFRPFLIIGCASWAGLTETVV